jgi:2-(3-amino-3-carboxypropyl)histidine synthase
MKTLFIPVHSKENIIPLLEKSLSFLKKTRKVSIFTTIQYANKISEIKKFYEKNKIKIEILNSTKKHEIQGISAKEPSQILGCDATAAKKATGEKIIYIGSGEFHPIAIYLNLKKEIEIIKINPESKSIEKYNANEIKKFLAKRAARLQKIKDSKKIGIWITTKPGQYNEKLALKAKKILEKKGKKTYLFVSDVISGYEMQNFPDIQAWVNTACPRIIEDQPNFPKPIVNAEEVINEFSK